MNGSWMIVLLKASIFYSVAAGLRAGQLEAELKLCALIG
jgi:hypothetical protein